MAFANTPGNKERAPRKGTDARGGDLIPDIGSAGSTTGARGRYPADGSFLDGVRDSRSGGRSGDPYQITAPTKQVTRQAPKASPRARTSNPIK